MCWADADPILAYSAGAEVNQLQWSTTQPDWVAICFANKTQARAHAGAATHLCFCLQSVLGNDTDMLLHFALCQSPGMQQTCAALACTAVQPVPPAYKQY